MLEFWHLENNSKLFKLDAMLEARSDRKQDLWIVIYASMVNLFPS